MAKKRQVRRKKIISRKTTSKKSSKGGAYFAESNLEFISSGCDLLDLALGGGWPIGRVSNIVGDKSTGKTLLAIEAIANAIKKFGDDVDVYYQEAEAAFNKKYAASLGLPVERVHFIEDLTTIEGFYKQLDSVAQKHKDSGRRALYILDSLDALSDEAEMSREIGKSSYGAEKAKKMSELFRKLTRKVEQANVHLMVISQIRDKMNVTFGKKTTRSGGRALDFYASQVVFLAEKGKLKKTVKGITRPIGINVIAKIEKNKVGTPYREVEFPVIFSYGVDTLTANLNFLASVGGLSEVEPKLTKANISRFITSTAKLSDKEYRMLMRKSAKITKKMWNGIEDGFRPSRVKY